MKEKTAGGWREQMAKSIAESKRNMPTHSNYPAEPSAKVLEDGTIYYSDGHALKSRVVIPLMLAPTSDNQYACLMFVPCDSRAEAMHALDSTPSLLLTNKFGAVELTRYANGCFDAGQPLYVRAMNLTTTVKVSKGVRYDNPILTRTGWADFNTDEDLMVRMTEVVDKLEEEFGFNDPPMQPQTQPVRRKF